MRDRARIVTKLRTTRLADSHCPACRHRISGATGTGSRKPSPGDATVCCYCGVICVFGDDLTMRLPSPEALAQLQSNAGLWRLLTDISALYDGGAGAQ